MTVHSPISKNASPGKKWKIIILIAYSISMFCLIIQKTYSNFWSYTQSYARWTVEDSIIERNLADLSSTVKSSCLPIKQQISLSGLKL